MTVLSKKKVLIVEDDLSIREALQELMEDEGYQVDVAGNGKEALGKLEAGLPFVVLLDLMMPVMDGFAFLQTIQQMPSGPVHNIPVFLLTAAGDRAKSVTGVRAVLKKPIDLEALLSELKKIDGA